MIYESNCPSKSFIAGEYAVLVGGKGLILNHGPFFHFRVKDTQSFEDPFWVHPESPVGRLYARFKGILRRYRLDFFDPYAGQGGFGASGAQFVLLYGFLKSLQVPDLAPHVFEEFKNCDQNGSSGADVLAQSLGEGLVEVNPNEGVAQLLGRWQFGELVYVVCPTRKKVNTHEHLNRLNRNILSPIVQASDRVLSSYRKKDSGQFVVELSNLNQVLEDLGLQAAHTHEWIQKIQAIPGVFSVKGCGALGSDALILMVDRALHTSVMGAIMGMGLMVMTSNRDQND